MFKIDWPCAVGGLVIGYYTKGKVIKAKESFKKISDATIASFKEAMEDDQPTQAGQQTAEPTTQQGKKGH